MAMSVFGAAANPRVLDAVMRQTKLWRPKWDLPHFSTGQTYGAHTIVIVITSSRWANKTSRSPPPPPPPLCLYAQPRTKADRLEKIMRYVTDTNDLDAAGYARLPVGELDALMGVHRNSITNNIRDLGQSGRLETISHNVSLRSRQRRARLAVSQNAATSLDTLVLFETHYSRNTTRLRIAESKAA